MQYTETVYKKDSKGKVRKLTINAIDGKVHQISGLMDGKKVEHVSTSKPKNIGKANETTITEQAVLEAAAKIKNKLDQGYFKTVAETDKEVILPMLAKSYDKESKKVDWSNAYVQPKLDGMRCIKRGTELMSRKGKDISTLPHIADEIANPHDYLDGELYAHGLTFQENMSIIKKNRPDSIKVKYHVYDVIKLNNTFIERYEWLCKIVANCKNIEIVPTFKVNSEKELNEYHQKFISEGYEGSILRWGDAGYALNQRSSNLLKYKDFIDMVYKVVDVEPSDKNPEQGVIICEGFKSSPDGDQLGERFTFGCGMKFAHKEREEILANKSDYIGQTAEIRFFEYTDDGLPRFPVCVGFRLDK